MTASHEALYERALKVIPWATQTNAKRYDAGMIAARPPFIKRAKGCRMWDLDNKEYIDFRCSLGPIILGYQYAEIDNAVRAQMDKGTLFSMASPLETETAEAILETVGWADKIRFMKTGADACACCLRLARSFTGRDHLLTSGYHGYQDWFALAQPNSGVPESLNDYVHSIDYGDLEAIDRIFDRWGEQLAAALIAPVEWHLEPSPEYLQKLRAKCDEYGTLLVFDEVLTGFRPGKRGAQEYFGITPDLSAYAKGMANGYPLSAYAGKARYMDTLNQMIITITYAGKTLSLAASKAVMEVFQREPVFEHIFAMGDRLRKGFDGIFDEFDFPAHTVGLAPAVTIAFEGSGEQSSDRRRGFFNILYEKGIFANNEWFISYSHQACDIDETLDKMREAVKELT